MTGPRDADRRDNLVMTKPDDMDPKASQSGDAGEATRAGMMADHDPHKMGAPDQHADMMAEPDKDPHMTETPRPDDMTGEQSK